jgi:hypothetical protein
MSEKLKITDEQFAELQKRFPEPDYELARVSDLPPGDVVLRNPSEQEYNAFQAQAFDDESRRFADKNLMLMTVVFPESAVFAKWLKRYPGLQTHERLRKALRALNGSTDAAMGKG